MFAAAALVGPAAVFAYSVWPSCFAAEQARRRDYAESAGLVVFVEALGYEGRESGADLVVSSGSALFAVGAFEGARLGAFEVASLAGQHGPSRRGIYSAETLSYHLERDDATRPVRAERVAVQIGEQHGGPKVFAQPLRYLNAALSEG